MIKKSAQTWYYENGNIKYKTYYVNCLIHRPLEEEPAFTEYLRDGRIKCQEYHINGRHIFNLNK